MVHDESAGEPESTPQRKPYAPPRIVESGRFETLVLNCSFDVSFPGGCEDNPTPQSLS